VPQNPDLRALTLIDTLSPSLKTFLITDGASAPHLREGEIIQLSDHRPSPPIRVKQKSQYELYPLPFFDRKRCCTWDVTPSDDYSADCDTGAAFAIEFLKSCDKTYGWASLMPTIIADMIRAGAADVRPDGRPSVNGIVIGFMGVIGSALMHSRVLD
jgi:hypothetical protein